MNQINLDGLDNSSLLYDNDMEKEIRIYKAPQGKEPFTEWLQSIGDVKMRARIRARLDRLAFGHYGDRKSVGHNIHELRLDFGPGYRIYFGEHGRQIIILLCGGDKSSQSMDIAKAQSYWQQLRGQKDD